MDGASKAKLLFESGQVREAARQLTEYLRERPTDVAQRTFLFELLCFSGDFSRAEKQLSVLSQGGPQAEMGAVLYYSALHAEKTRHQLFETQNFPTTEVAAPLPGEINGKPFTSIRDADPDIGARLEVFAAGAYLWIPFAHIASVELDSPKKLRDTLWMPAFVRTGPAFKGTELGEVLIPAIYPFSWKDPDEMVWLGRKTVWAADEQGTEYPSGLKTLLVDDEEIPFLEIRSLRLSVEKSTTVAATD